MKIIILNSTKKPVATFEWRNAEKQWKVIFDDNFLEEWWANKEYCYEANFHNVTNGHFSFFWGSHRIFNLNSNGFEVLVVDWKDWNDIRLELQQYIENKNRILKSKIYLKPDEKPPKDYEVKRGPKGGLYYESHVEIAPTAISEFESFPSKLMQCEVPKALYAQLLISKSSEDQLEYAYDIWTWFKKNNSLLSSEEGRIFERFYRSINRKIRIKLKTGFNAHVGKPKISAAAKKIKRDLESETPEKIRVNSEKFIGSFISEEKQTDPAQMDINSGIANISKIYPKFVSKFKKLTQEKNARKFLLKSEELLKDLDNIPDDEISRQVQWEIVLLRRNVISYEMWESVYSDLIKSKGDPDTVTKFVNNLNFGIHLIPKKKINDVRKLMTDTLLKLSPNVFNCVTSKSLRIKIVNKGDFYMACDRYGVISIDKSYFPKQASGVENEEVFMAGLLHEFTHLYEDSNQKFLTAERKLFNRRTKYSRLKTSSAWGRKYEAYRDRWSDIYMGRLYFGENFEITSMTIGEMVDEDNSYDSYIEDPELFLFAKEAMFDGKYEE